MSVHVQIERFEGPLGLLLHLIRREEMDIFDININDITKQYLEYIKKMKKFNLEVAGDFIAMAATLIHIKSRMLLPSYNEEGEEEETLDPRKELVQRLIEYQNFQDVSKRLYERPLVGRDVWLRGSKESITADSDEDDIEVEENPLFSLITAYRFVVRNMKKAIHKVGTELQSISERIVEIKSRLIPGQPIKFSSLIDQKEPETKLGQVLITFLSMLELGKLGFVKLFQAENFGEIHVEPIRHIETDAIQRVESYEQEPRSDEEIEFEAEHQEVHEITEEQMHLEPVEVEDTAVESFMANTKHHAEEEHAFEEDAATDLEIFQEEMRLGISPESEPDEAAPFEPEEKDLEI